MRGTVEVVGAASGPVAALAPAAASAAPSPAPTASPGQAAAASARVSAADDLFQPASLDVVVGTTVTWVNEGKAKHTVTFESGPSSDILASGASFTRTFSAPGTFKYLCALHPGMTGVVTVRAATSAASVTAGPLGTTVAPAAVAPGAAAPATLGATEGLVLGLAIGLPGAFVVGGLVIVAVMQRADAAA